MPLLGSAAMLLSFDVAAEAVPEHDHWHTYEHLPERLSIPGFLRGTRWVAVSGRPRYMVLYEVESLSTLTSPAYLSRLNAPSGWTAKMMPHYRGMIRGLCSVVKSTGFGVGQYALLVKFTPKPDTTEEVHAWLASSVLPRLPSQPGLGSAHLLKGAATADMTIEQRIRGADGTVDSAIIVTAHDEAALNEAASEIVSASGLGRYEPANITSAVYAMHYSLSSTEIEA